MLRSPETPNPKPCQSQACYLAEEVLKTEYDAARIIFNRFVSAIAFKPTISTVLSPDVRGP